MAYIKILNSVNLILNVSIQENDNNYSIVINFIDSRFIESTVTRKELSKRYKTKEEAETVLWAIIGFIDAKRIINIELLERL